MIAGCFMKSQAWAKLHLRFLPSFEKSEEESDAKGDEQHSHRNNIVQPLETTLHLGTEVNWKYKQNKINTQGS